MALSDTRTSQVWNWEPSRRTPPKSKKRKDAESSVFNDSDSNNNDPDQTPPPIGQITLKQFRKLGEWVTFTSESSATVQNSVLASPLATGKAFHFCKYLPARLKLKSLTKLLVRSDWRELTSYYNIEAGLVDVYYVYESILRKGCRRRGVLKHFTEI